MTMADLIALAAETLMAMVCTKVFRVIAFLIKFQTHCCTYREGQRNVEYNNEEHENEVGMLLCKHFYSIWKLDILTSA